mgnify:CR=1 FL=1
MNITPQTQKYIAMGVAGLLAIILVVTLFKGSRKDNYPYKELIAAKDSIISEQKRAREILEAEIIEREISFEALETLDSVTYANYKQFQKINKLLDEKLKISTTVIARIRNNTDSIRAIYATFL